MSECACLILRTDALFNIFKSEFIIVIFIHYKPGNSRLVVDEDNLKCVTNKKNEMLILKQFVLKALGVGY